MIWCVEDDASIRDIEVYALTSTGFEARGFEDGTSFWDALQTEQPELVVLDVMLPGIDGVELLKRMKAMIPTMTSVRMPRNLAMTASTWLPIRRTIRISTAVRRSTSQVMNLLLFPMAESSAGARAQNLISSSSSRSNAG